MPSPKKRNRQAADPARDTVTLDHGGHSYALQAEGAGLFRLLVESVLDYAIFALTPDGTILTWNEGAQRIKGYEARDIIGRHFSMFYPEEDLKWDKPGMELRVAREEGRFEDEGWRKRKDGSLFWANVIITAVRDNAGTLVGFAKVTRDLSERRAAHERAIADARRIAAIEASSKAKTDFLAAMSHELRTPTQRHRWIRRAARDGRGRRQPQPPAGGLPAPRPRGTAAPARADQRPAHYSRIEAGQVEYDVTPVGVNAVVQKVVQLIEVQANRKSIRVTLQGCTGELLALADRVKVEQIVLNLLSNAVKFTPPGGRVEVRCQATPGHALVVIEDTGPGIPDSHRESIFEPFVQLGRSLTSTQEGIGLGLAISRDLARAMDGDIVVSRSPLGGAMFTLSLRAA